MIDIKRYGKDAPDVVGEMKTRVGRQADINLDDEIVASVVHFEMRHMLNGRKLGKQGGSFEAFECLEAAEERTRDTR